MRIVKYSFAILFIVILTLGAESFIQKKTPTQQRRVKLEDIVALNSDVLDETIGFFKEAILLLETVSQDVKEIVAQKKNGYFTLAGQDDLRSYQDCALKIKNKMQECVVGIHQEHTKLKKRCF